MTRNQNDDASSSKSLKTSDNNALRAWSNLNQDILLIIMMILGPADFFAFNRVCKPWRSLALSHINKFMGSRRPLSVTFSTDTCDFEDFEGRVSKTILPHSTSRTCVGATCGYMILYGRETRDFWLVNPFTKHELHVPSFASSYMVNTNPSIFRGILVFSPSTFQPVFVFLHKFTKTIYSYVSGKHFSWYYHNLTFPILDIHSFKGKIYTITSGSHLFEVRLHPKPTLTPVGLKNLPTRELLRPEFVNSGKNLYVADCFSADMYVVYEIDFEKMEWVLREKTTLEYAFFVGDWKSSAAVNPDTWDDRRMRDERLGYLKDTDKSKVKGRCLIADMWYFPHDCLNVNTLQLE